MTTSHALGLETGRGADREIASEYECELLSRFRIAAPNRKEMQGDSMPCRVVHTNDGFDTRPKLRRRTTCIYGIEPGADGVEGFRAIIGAKTVDRRWALAGLPHQFGINREQVAGNTPLRHHTDRHATSIGTRAACGHS